MKSTSSSEHKTLESPLSVRTKTASRIMYSMRRSFSYSTSTEKKRQSDVSSRGMYSTPEERNAYPISYPGSSSMCPSHPPTHQQIAMGLHLSRTPHLRPVGTPHHRHSAPASHNHLRCTSPHTRNTSLSRDDFSRHAVSLIPPLPAPPSRSSLKKSSMDASTSTITSPVSLGLLAASTSSSTVTSTAPSTPQSSRSVMSLKLRMPKFTRATKPSGDQEAEAPRKAVRFSTNIIGPDGLSSRD